MSSPSEVHSPIPPQGAQPSVSRFASLVVLLCTFTASLDTTMVGLGLAEISKDMGRGLATQWLVSAKLLAVVAVLPISGWLADRIGRRPVFLASVICFAVASAGAAMAPTFELLVSSRMLQGVGTGMMQPVGMAMLLEMSPRERHGRTMALWAMSGQLGPIFGPTFGGWLITFGSWRMIFVVDALVAAVSSVVGVLVFPGGTRRRARQPLDIVSLFLATGGLALMVLGLSEANSWGWSSVSVQISVVGGLLALVVVVMRLRQRPDPLINVRMFADRPFALAMGVVVLTTGLQFSRLVFVPLALQSVREISAAQVGVLFLPAGIAGIVASRLAGAVTDRRGPKGPIVVGTALMALSLVGFATVDLAGPLWVITVLLSFHSVGFAMACTAGIVAGMSDLPASQLAQGSALRTMSTQVGLVLMVAVLGAVVNAGVTADASQSQAEAAYHTAFVAAAGCGVVAVLLGLAIPRRQKCRVAGLESTDLMARSGPRVQDAEETN
jgi:EmrB/QacA subfamily drug resistance transporter